MPALPGWAPPPELAAALAAAAAALAALPPPLQSISSDGTLDAPRSLAEREQHEARWRPHLEALGVAAGTARGTLALRLADGVLAALCDTVRYRRRGDELRLAVLRLALRMCSGQGVDVVHDLDLVGFHRLLARQQGAGAEAAEPSAAEQEDDELVADIITAIAGSGHPFCASQSPSEPRPSPLQFAVHGDAADALLVRQVPKPVGEQFDVGFLLWPNAVLLSRFLCARSGAGAEARRSLLAGARVLELGAGLGLVGLSVATCARRDGGMRAAPKEVVLSDFNPTVLDSLRYNIALNCDGQGQRDAPEVRAAKLDFGAAAAEAVKPLPAGTLAVPPAMRGFGWRGEGGEREAAADVVVGADVMCSVEDARSIAATLQLVLAWPHGVAYLSLPHSDARFGATKRASSFLLAHEGSDQGGFFAQGRMRCLGSSIRSRRCSTR